MKERPVELLPVEALSQEHENKARWLVGFGQIDGFVIDGQKLFVFIGSRWARWNSGREHEAVWVWVTGAEAREHGLI